MKEDINNKLLQQIIFIVSLMIVFISAITVFSSGFASLFNFKSFDQPLTTKQQPLFIISIFAVVALIFSWKNLRRIKNQKKEV